MLYRIKKIKKENKITNEQLSLLTGISLGTLSKILAGVTREPSVETVIKIATALNVSADFLITGNLQDFNKNFSLTDNEKKLITAYREHPEMQVGINKMLDIDNDSEMRQILKVNKYTKKNNTNKSVPDNNEEYEIVRIAARDGGITLHKMPKEIDEEILKNHPELREPPPENPF